jgi:hypothetical protein
MLNDIVQYCGSQEELMTTFKTLQKALIERAMEGELAYHLGFIKNMKDLIQITTGMGMDKRRS